MLLRDGAAEVAFGAMGGDGQPQTMVQLVQGIVDDGLDPQAAVDRPRFVVETDGSFQPLGPVNMEADGVDVASVAELETRGHRVTLIEPKTPMVGWAQMIRRLPDGSYEGGADPRADSLAAGI
jgi:gamma-glutamyltranspeptidase